MKVIIAFFQALPELIKLVTVLQKAADEAETSRKVKEDVAEIHQAFLNKDANALNNLFSNLK